MIRAFLSIMVFFSGSAWAFQPPDLGQLKGLIFSSVAVRHPIEIQGGNLVRCVPNPQLPDEITVCDVENGTLRILGKEQNALEVNLLNVSVLQTTYSDGEKIRYYRFRCSANLMIDGKLVPMNIRAQVNRSEKDPGKLSGHVEFTDQGVKTFFEVYQVGR